MGTLGGGGPQTLFGYKCCDPNAHVGLAAGLGPDLPPPCMDWFRTNDIDTAALTPHPTAPTPRAWQIVEKDGRRHEIWRTERTKTQEAMLLPPFTSIPPSLQQARGLHVAVNPSIAPFELLQQIRDTGNPDVTISVETFCNAANPMNKSAISKLVSLCDVFSPNTEEAMSMLGICPGSMNGNSSNDNIKDIKRLMDPFMDLGAKVMVLRRGAAGAVVAARSTASPQTVKYWSVSAVPNIDVIDTTGCGNAFCGAFMAKLLGGGREKEAAVAGCAAASVVAEHRGIPPGSIAQNYREEVRRREGLVQVKAI